MRADRAACPINQLQMMKLLVNQSLYSQGLHATQMLGTVFDGIARHTKEGYAFQAQAAREGFRAAVRERDEPFGGLRADDRGPARPDPRAAADAARELIEEGGYGAASVAAIAERAGVAAGTLYRHFASKEELFVEVFRSVCDREVRAMRDGRRRRCRPTPRMSSGSRRCSATFARRALRRPRLAWALIAEPVDPLVDAERLAYRERYSELTAAGAPRRDRRGRAARAERRADRGGARRRLRRGAGRAAVAARRREAGPTRRSWRRCGRSCAGPWASA